MDNIILKKYYTEPTHKYSLISASVFRIENFYRPTTDYYNGLKMLVDEFSRYFPGFYFRIYYDTSIVQTDSANESVNIENRTMWIPLIEKMKQMDKIQLVQYTYPEFVVNKHYHQGLFGTLVRFIPLFDYKDNENIKTVYVSDIDLKKDDLVKYHEVYKQFMKSKSMFHYSSRPCYRIIFRLALARKNLDDKHKSSIPYTIIAGSIISKIKFPHRLLDDFLNCMRTENRASDSCIYIDNFTNIKKSNDKTISAQFKKVQSLEKSEFGYGIDEFFLDAVVLKYIETHRIPISVTLKSEIMHVLYNNFLRYDGFDKPDSDIVKFYSKVMGKYYDKNRSFKDNHTYLDKIVYGIDIKSGKNRKTVYEYFLNNLKNSFRELYTNNNYEKYQFTKDELMCVLNIPEDNPYETKFLIHDYDKKIGGYYDKYKKYKTKYLNL